MHAINIAPNRSFCCIVCGGLRHNFQHMQKQLHGSNMFDIFHMLLHFLEGNCLFSRRCAVNARHATKNIQTTNEKPALKHVTSSFDSKMATNIAGVPWTSKKRRSTCGNMETFPCLFDTSRQEYSNRIERATCFDQN